MSLSSLRNRHVYAAGIAPTHPVALGAWEARNCIPNCEWKDIHIIPYRCTVSLESICAL